MKRFSSLSVAAAITLSAITGGAALAQPYSGPPGHPPGPGYEHPHGPPGPGWHHWHQGDYYHGNRYVVNDWQHYRLRPPPHGYQWVQDDGQFVLIAVASGIVADIIINSQYQ